LELFSAAIESPAGAGCHPGGIAAGVGVHQPLHQRMAHHIGGGEATDGDPLHPLQHLSGLDQAAQLAGGEVDLGVVEQPPSPNLLWPLFLRSYL